MTESTGSMGCPTVQKPSLMLSAKLLRGHEYSLPKASTARVRLWSSKVVPMTAVTLKKVPKASYKRNS